MTIPPDDRAARFLARAVRWMPANRREWGAAMRAELQQIHGAADRWRFALGCAWVALLPPGRGIFNALAGRPMAAALLGFLCGVPFLLANFIVANRVEPFFSLIRPGPHTSPREYVLFAVVLLLILLGAFTALGPWLVRDAGGKRHFPVVNGAIAALMLIAFTVISSAVGAEIYACEVLQVPNCD
jgi:hypothetical protein